MIMTATPFRDKQSSQLTSVCQALSASEVKKRHLAENGDLAVAFQRVHSVASKSPSFFPLMRVCFDLSISPQTTIKKAIYQINTEYCKSHLQAACTFPRRGCHANSGSMCIVQRYQFQQSPASEFWGLIQSCRPSPFPKCAHMAKTPPKSGKDQERKQWQN